MVAKKQTQKATSKVAKEQIKNIPKVTAKIGKEGKAEDIKVTKDIKEAKADNRVSKICDVCGKDFDSPWSGAKYCATCSADKKKARRKAANKRRIVNRKDELYNLRNFKDDLIACIDSPVKKDMLANLVAIIDASRDG